MSEPPSSPLSLKPTDVWNSMSVSRLTFTGKDLGITKTLAALGILSLIAMLLGGLAVLLLFHLSYRQDNIPSEEVISTRIGGLEWSTRFIDSSEVLSCFCVMLCLCSVVSCSAQCYFAAKMLKLPQGEERYVLHTQLLSLPILHSLYRLSVYITFHSHKHGSFIKSNF